MEQAVILKPGELDQIIEGVKRQVVEEFKTLKGSVVEKPIGLKEAASFLGVHRTTIFKWIADGTMPSSIVHRTGKILLFFPSELNEFIKKS